MPTVRLDKERIERAITNLITSALKYGSADKPVVMRVEQRDHQAVICVADLQVWLYPHSLFEFRLGHTQSLVSWLAPPMHPKLGLGGPIGAAEKVPASRETGSLGNKPTDLTATPRSSHAWLTLSVTVYFS